MLLPLYNSPKTKVRMSDPTSERIRLIDGTLPLYNATRATYPWPGCLKLLCFGSLALVRLPLPTTSTLRHSPYMLPIAAPVQCGTDRD